MIELFRFGLAMRRALRRCCAVALAGCALLLWAALPAGAHASLVSTDPPDGAVLEQAPGRFALLFSEPVSPLVLAVVGPGGARTVLPDFTLRDRTLEVAAPPGLGAGTHVLTWRVISADGHPVGGSAVFSIGAPSAAPPLVEAIDWNVRAGLWSGKVLLYAGLFLGVGGLVMRLWLVDGRGDFVRPPLALLCLGMAGAALSLGFQGLDALGAPLPLLFDGSTWEAGLRTSFGLTAVSAGVAFFLALTCWLLPRSQARGLSLFALLMAGAALAASGHASVAAPQGLTRPAVFVHAVTIALWTGALLPLAAAMRGGGGPAAVALRRFSAFIPFAVAALIAAGAVLTVIQVETPAALLGTDYGRVMLAKLALLSALFALAAFNRWRLTAPALAGDLRARRSMVRSVGAETAVVLMIFAVAAVWRFTPPPRALTLAATAPAEVHIHGAEATAAVLVTPGRVGTATAEIRPTNADYAPIMPKEITLVLGNKAAGIEPIRRPAARSADGVWRADDLTLPVPGIWQVRVDVLVSDFKLVRLPGEVVIRP